ncbi:MAG: glycogen/starch synthase [Pseudomonadota bacterium]
MTRVLMLAAENAALPGGKVGGVGDVIAELPLALAELGHQVDVLLPAYGIFHQHDDAQRRAAVEVSFAGSLQRVELYEIVGQRVGTWVLHHPLFGEPPGQIYHADGADAPFATDANLYALFCCAAAELVAAGELGAFDVVHLHDWHAAAYALFHRRLPSAGRPRLVLSIHNLSLQGIRPLSGHPSSPGSWFPKLPLPPDARDPRYADCFNPLRLAIRGADAVHVVSPSYAREILLPSATEEAIYGGEGLEDDLRAAADADRLHGILNGCDAQPAAESGRRELWQRCQTLLLEWISAGEHLRTVDYLAERNLGELLAGDGGGFLVTSVGRLTTQKVGLLLHPHGAGCVLDALLEPLRGRGAMVMLGSGDADSVAQLRAVAARHRHFVLLEGYSDAVADALYASGDLFVMPSLFEPCGLSQMIAMRNGQPCLVHGVGGLRDTVSDGQDGFVFSGDGLEGKADALIERFGTALQLHHDEPAAWGGLCRTASERRFLWRDAAEAYVERLYLPPDDA